METAWVGRGQCVADSKAFEAGPGTGRIGIIGEAAVRRASTFVAKSSRRRSSRARASSSDRTARRPRGRRSSGLFRISRRDREDEGDAVLVPPPAPPLFCSALVRNGVSVEAVRVLAGHADLERRSAMSTRARRTSKPACSRSLANDRPHLDYVRLTRVGSPHRPIGAPLRAPVGTTGATAPGPMPSSRPGDVRSGHAKLAQVVHWSRRKNVAACATGRARSAIVAIWAGESGFHERASSALASMSVGR